MKFHLISIVGMLAGLTLAIAGGIRYFIIWEDYSQLIQFVLAGANIMAISYIVNWMKNKDISDEARDKKVEGVIKIYAKGEFE